MSVTPVWVNDELFDRLRARFDEAAMVESSCGPPAVQGRPAREAVA